MKAILIARVSTEEQRDAGYLTLCMKRYIYSASSHNVSSFCTVVLGLNWDTTRRSSVEVPNRMCVMQ